MSVNNHDNPIDYAEYSLEAILAEYEALGGSPPEAVEIAPPPVEAESAPQDGEEAPPPRDFAFPRPPAEERSRRIVMEALNDTIRTARFAYPGEPPAPPAAYAPDEAPEETPEEVPEEAAEADPGEAPPEDTRRLPKLFGGRRRPRQAEAPPGRAPVKFTFYTEASFSAEAPAAGDKEPENPVSYAYVRQLVDADENTAYAAPDYSRKAPEPPPESRGVPKTAKKRDLSELLLSPLITLLAVIAVRRQARTAKGPRVITETEAPEVPPARAAKLYAAQEKPLKVRALIAFALCAVLVYISYAYGSKLPLLGAMHGSVRVAALMCLLLELAVMLAGLDVFTAGLLSLLRGAPNAESLVAVSCLLSLLDAGYIAAKGGSALGLPYCAVSALSVAFALWGSRLYCSGLKNSLRVAALSKNPHILTAEADVYDGDPGIVKSRGLPRGFVRRCEEPDMAEEAYSTLAPFLLMAALVLAALAAVRGRMSFFHALSALTAVSASFSAFLAFSLPFSVVARRILSSGAAIAGCAGAVGLGKSGRLVITDTDLFPAGTLSIESIRILEGTFTDKVISYTGSLMACSGGGMSPVFTELMSRNGCVMRHVEDFSVHEGGGLTGLIRGEQVLVGTSGFMQLMGIRLPQKQAVKTAVFAAIGGSLVGVFNVNYTPVSSVQDALVSLLHGKSRPVFAIRDFNITPLLIRQRFKMPTDGFDFPTFAKRYDISSVQPDESSEVSAVISREGLGPMVEAAENGRRLYRSARLCAFLSVLGSCLGVALMFFLFFSGASDAFTVANMMSFMFLWLVPLLVVSLDLRRL